MSRFLFSTLPPLGHVFPTIAIAKKLREAGHEVSYACHGELRNLIEAQGFKFHELTTTMSMDRVQKFFPQYHSIKKLRRIVYFLRLLFSFREQILPGTPRDVETLLTIFQEARPDVFVTVPYAPAAGIAAALSEIPWATVSMFPGWIPEFRTHPYGPGLPLPKTEIDRIKTLIYSAVNDQLEKYFFDAPISKLRKKHGLQRLDHAFARHNTSPYLYLACVPREFEYERKSWPSQVHFVGPCLWDNPGAHELPQNLKSPLVYLTLGTVQSILRKEFFEYITDALKEFPGTVLVTTGQTSVAAAKMPRNVIAEGYIPNSLILPRADAMIHHGGFSTTLCALQHGVPSVIIPLEGDQFENSERAVRTGAAIRLDHPSKREIRESVAAIFRIQSYRAAAKRWKEIFARHDGPAASARLLARLSETKQPVLFHAEEPRTAG